MSNRLFWEALGSLYSEAGRGFASALDDIRQKVVEQGWSGQVQTASLADNIHGTGSRPETTVVESRVLTQGDPLGRTPDAEAPRDWLTVPAGERASMQALYQRHLALGTSTALEVENAMDRQYNGWSMGHDDRDNER